ncbi:MAG: hypothetical protein DI534_14925 [Leifsonia xyli]|nr:MAG: hypothetical protein DI534_14925 [Leifsonia xyli]
MTLCQFTRFGGIFFEEFHLFTDIPTFMGIRIRTTLTAATTFRTATDRFFKPVLTSWKQITKHIFGSCKRGNADVFFGNHITAFIDS